MFHHVADCQNCPWYLDARNVQGAAQRHANAYGHTVSVSIGYLAKPNAYSVPTRGKVPP